jgi:hypothetical protein
MLGLPEPIGDWSNAPLNNASVSDAAWSAVNTMQQQDSMDDVAITAAINGSPLSVVIPSDTITDPSITSWMINFNGATAKSSNATINAEIDTIQANVQKVGYTSTDVYVNATGLPDYNIGPWGSDPNVAKNQSATFDINRNPTAQSGTKTVTGLGAIGVLVNGVAVFNAEDGTSYNNKGYWHPNAIVKEGSTFDTSGGHPQQQGVYHYHEAPTSLLSELGQSSSSFGPLIGYAIDGFPIYGEYASTNSDGTGAIERMTSSYQLRNITTRTTLADGTVLPTADDGPAVNSTYPLGYFVEDYQYVAGSGTLDQYNGRFIDTPQYPGGTYAYFVSTDSAGDPTYPYILGPDYYGTPLSDDLPGSTVTVPGNVTYYTPEPASLSLLAGGCIFLCRRRRKGTPCRA